MSRPLIIVSFIYENLFFFSNQMSIKDINKSEDGIKSAGFLLVIIYKLKENITNVTVFESA